MPSTTSVKRKCDCPSFSIRFEHVQFSVQFQFTVLSAMFSMWGYLVLVLCCVLVLVLVSSRALSSGKVRFVSLVQLVPSLLFWFPCLENRIAWDTKMTVCRTWNRVGGWGCCGSRSSFCFWGLWGPRFLPYASPSCVAAYGFPWGDAARFRTEQTGF